METYANRKTRMQINRDKHKYRATQRDRDTLSNMGKPMDSHRATQNGTHRNREIGRQTTRITHR